MIIYYYVSQQDCPKQIGNASEKGHFSLRMKFNRAFLTLQHSSNNQNIFHSCYF